MPMSRPPLTSMLRPSALRLAALAAAALLVLTWLWLAPGQHRAFEDASSDPLWRSAASRAVEDERRTVIIDIDEASLARVGAWPWPRETIARLVGALHAQGAAVQVLDIVFPESRAGDPVLAAALARHSVHLGQIFALTPETVSHTKMTLFREVTPLLIQDFRNDSSVMRRNVEQRLMDAGAVSNGDLIVLIYGELHGTSGGTNTMTIVRVGEV